MTLVIAAGLLWRSGIIPLPPFLRKYGGDALWSLLIFLGVGCLFVRAATWRATLTAVCFCWAVEFSQLYHASWIDSVRSTRLGGLVLGATFNWPDLIAYGVGVMIGGMTEIILGRGRKS